LIDRFGWKGAMLITAGLVLNCIIFGALFRPLEAPKKGKKTQVTDNEHLFNLVFLWSFRFICKKYVFEKFWLLSWPQKVGCRKFFPLEIINLIHAWK
jgi:hypothetical protein